MIGCGLAVIRQYLILVDVVIVVNLGDFDFNKDLTVYHRFDILHVKRDLQTIIRIKKIRL
jgi:hypothetical protein